MAAKEAVAPDFRAGDLVAGVISTRVIKTWRARDISALMYGHLENATEYEERESSSEFFTVSVPPYKVHGVWMMVVRSKGEHPNDEEVECEKFHLVGGRKEEINLKRIVMEQAKKFKTPIIAGGIVLVLFMIGGWFAANFNSLVMANEDVDNAWSKVETQYQRRFDLIGNVVESVKGSQLQEQKVFGDIANARKQYQSAGSSDEKAEAASSLETNIALIPRLQEAYPELKSNENVQMLMKELAGTEGQIATVRDKYNDTVTNYNKNVRSFPKNIFAGMFGYGERSQFKAASGANVAPTVNFTKDK